MRFPTSETVLKKKCLICDALLKPNFFCKNGYVKVWIEKEQVIAPSLGAIALHDAILPFATTYLAENEFSAVTHTKTKARNRLVLHNNLRLALTDLSPNIKSLCKHVQSQGQGSH